VVGGRRARSTAAATANLTAVDKGRKVDSSSSSAVKVKAKPFSKIPGPVALPFYGTLWTYRFGKYGVERYKEHLTAMYAKYGPLARDVLGGTPVVRVFEPVDAREVLRADGKYPIIPPLQESAKMFRTRRGYGLGLGNTNGVEWHTLRNPVQKVLLKPRSIQSYLPDVNAVSDDFVRRIKEDRDTTTRVLPNMRNLVAKWHMETAASIAFERRLGILGRGVAEARAERMINVQKTSFRLSSDLKFSLPIYRYINTPKWAALERSEDEFYNNAVEFSKGPIAEVMELMKKGPLTGEKFNFLTMLLSRPDIPPREAIVLCMSLQGDGLTATVPTLMNALYCISSNPRVQQKLYEEVQRVLPPDGYVTQEVINKLHYLKTVIKETLRFCPLNTEVARISQKDFVLSGYHVPKGTTIDVNTIVLYRSAKFFPKPNEFIPERWERHENDKDTDDVNRVYSFTPFGHGTRMCIGRRFAEQDLQAAIAKIIRKFRLTYLDSEPMEQVYHTLMLPKKDPKIEFVERK